MIFNTFFFCKKGLIPVAYQKFLLPFPSSLFRCSNDSSATTFQLPFQDTSRFDPLERKVFWGGLVVGPLLWAMLVSIAFITFKWEWMVIALMGLAMNGANLYGYLRCKWTSTQDFTNYVSKWAFLSVSFFQRLVFISFITSDICFSPSGFVLFYLCCFLDVAEIYTDLATTEIV